MYNPDIKSRCIIGKAWDAVFKLERSRMIARRPDFDVRYSITREKVRKFFAARSHPTQLRVKHWYGFDTWRVRRIGQGELQVGCQIFGAAEVRTIRKWAREGGKDAKRKRKGA